MTLNDYAATLSNDSTNQRLDCALVIRSLAETRNTAQHLIRAGVVTVSYTHLTLPTTERV